MKWFLILITVCASSCGDVLCASGMSEGEEIQGISRVARRIVTRRKVVLGGLCYLSAFVSLLALLSIVPLSVAVPATALSFVIDTLAARLILRERVPWRRWAGVLCVTAGVVLAVRPASSGRSSGTNSASIQANQEQPHHPGPGSIRLGQRTAATLTEVTTVRDLVARTAKCLGCG